MSNALTTKAVDLGASLVYQFDEASGSLVDQVGSNNATASGTPVYQANGVPGSDKAITFDGSTDYFTLDSNVLNGASAYTVEAWVNLDATGSSQIIFDERDGSGDGAILFFASGGIPRAIHNGSGGVDGPSIPAGSWHHVAATWDGSNVTVYTDGEAGTPTSVATALATTVQPRVGARSYSVTQYLDGNIAHLAIYPTALSQADVIDLYLTGQPQQSTYQLDLSASAVDALISNSVVRVSSTSLPTADNDSLFSSDTGSGANVWFSSDADGSLPIAAKLLHWDDSGEVFAFDVAAGTLSAVTGGTIYMHVGSKPSGYDTDPYPASTLAVTPLIDDANDDSSNGNNATATGSPTFGGSTGPDGSLPATDLDGSTQYFAYGSNLLNGASEYTIQAHIRSSTTGGTARIVDERDAAGDGVVMNYHGNDTFRAIHNNKTAEASPGVTSDQWYHVASRWNGTSVQAMLDGVQAGSGTDSTAIATTTVMHIGRSSFAALQYFDGEITNVSVHNVYRSDAEINLDYLLQGPNAATYWTVTDLTTLPDPTFELRSDRDVTLSGSNVTSWGNASGGTSPTYSNDAADRILGFPAIQFASGSSQYLEWDEIASMFSGDEPDFTLAILHRPSYVSGLHAPIGTGRDNGGAGDPYFMAYVSSTTAANASRRDTASVTDFWSSIAIVDNTPGLWILKSEGGVGSMLYRRLDTGTEVSTSADYSLPASATMDVAAVGALVRSTTSNYYNGDIARIRLYNQALGGDLTDLADGTQLALLRDEMLRTAEGGLLSKLLYTIPGVRLGVIN